MKLYKIQDTKHINYMGADTIKDDVLPKGAFIDEDTISIKAVFKGKPIMLEVNALVKKNGQKKRRRKRLEFKPPLLQALKQANKLRDEWLDELRLEFVQPSKRSTVTFTSMPTLREAYDAYVEHKQKEYELLEREFNKTKFTAFANKWFKKIYSKKIDEITHADLTDVMIGMKDKNTGAPLSLRSKHTVLQTLSPMYNWLMGEPHFLKLNNPAKKTKADGRLNNERDIIIGADETKQLFKLLANNPHPFIRGVFTFLLHGRRLNEVLSLQWQDLNLTQNTYKIKPESNKAGVPMTYVLNERLLYVLNDIGIKKSGFVFPAINEPNKKMSQGTLRNHWESARKQIKEFTLNDIQVDGTQMRMHDIRHVIGGYLGSNGTSMEIIGKILGHKGNANNITSRYVVIDHNTADKAITGMLDEVLK